METQTIAPRATVAEINLDHLTHNVTEIRGRTQVKVMGIVKANAYGHGLIPVAQHLERVGVEYLGVAFLEEGIALRRAGIQLPILVLGGVCSHQIEHFLDFNLEINVSSMDKLKQAEEIAKVKNRKAVIHLKIDTGMERIGVHDYSAKSLIEAALKSKHCEIKGIFSHFACSDEPDSQLSSEQLERFNEVLEHFHRLGAPLPLRHMANSGGILHYPESFMDMVRPGILMYGVYPTPESHRTMEVKP